MTEEYIYPTEQSFELHEQITGLLLKQDLKGAVEIIDNLISGKTVLTNTIADFAKIEFAARYIDIADDMTLYNDLIHDSNKLIKKAFGIFNQINKDIEIVFESFISKNRARAYMIQFDNEYRLKIIKNNQKENGVPEVETMYEIKGTISNAIENYWRALQIEIDEEEKYNIRNNLSNALLRTGRYIEALTLLELNIKSLPERWQSNGSFADVLIKLIKESSIPTTASLFCVIAENYFKVAEAQLNEPEKVRVRSVINWCKLELEEFNMVLTKDLIIENRTEEMRDFEKNTDYRKLVLENSLSINEHAVYCMCLNSAKDTLKIGAPQGSMHLAKAKVFPILDGLVNRILSEFAYARLLYLNYTAEKKTDYPVDLDFSTLSGNEVLGYQIEQVRASYRIAYSILDKIANGILILFGIDKDRRMSYFEDVFDIYKDKLEEINNIHLTALYSLSLDLNRGNGSLKHFKDKRNEMEHGYLAVHNENGIIPEITSISDAELKQFTFEVLQLARAAIFSFVFLIRTETIYPL